MSLVRVNWSLFAPSSSCVFSLLTLFAALTELLPDLDCRLRSRSAPLPPCVEFHSEFPLWFLFFAGFHAFSKCVDFCKIECSRMYPFAMRDTSKPFSWRYFGIPRIQLFFRFACLAFFQSRLCVVVEPRSCSLEFVCTEFGLCFLVVDSFRCAHRVASRSRLSLT